MSDKTTAVTSIKSQDMSEMDDHELAHFKEAVIAKYATIGQLIELSSEPPCPHATEEQVVTDIPGAMWGTIMTRAAEMLGIDNIKIRRESKPWRKDKSMGYYYRSDVFYAIHKQVSTLVAMKARKTRAPVRSEDISTEELEAILDKSTLISND